MRALSTAAFDKFGEWMEQRDAELEPRAPVPAEFIFSSDEVVRIGTYVEADSVPEAGMKLVSASGCARDVLL